MEATSVEDDLNGRRPQLKTTSIEDSLNGRGPQWNTTSMEDDLNGRQSQWKTTLTTQEEGITGRRHYSKITLARLANQSLFQAWPSSAPACLLFFHI